MTRRTGGGGGEAGEKIRTRKARARNGSEDQVLAWKRWKTLNQNVALSFYCQNTKNLVLLLIEYKTWNVEMPLEVPGRSNPI